MSGSPEAEGAYLTRRCALRESLPPTEVTLQVYVPMSPDQVWEMWRVPSESSRMRGMDWTLITEPSFSQTCLEHKKYQSAGHIFMLFSFPSIHPLSKRSVSKAGLL